LYNRIDEILFFQPLTRDEVKQVAHRQLEALSRRLMEAREVQIVWTEEGIDMLLERGGYEPSLGARPVKRAIARLVEAPLAEMLLREELKAGDAVQVGATTDGKIELLVLD
jgi:ATP-dependent Clp protease ATP-binding subunit ClpC